MESGFFCFRWFFGGKIDLKLAILNLSVRSPFLHHRVELHADLVIPERSEVPGHRTGVHLRNPEKAEAAPTVGRHGGPLRSLSLPNQCPEPSPGLGLPHIPQGILLIPIFALPYDEVGTIYYREKLQRFMLLLLSMIVTASNPLLYAWMNQSFRFIYFRTFLNIELAKCSFVKK
jgi:hypothetical protein